MGFKHRSERGSSVLRCPESTRRPRLIVIRAAGGREQGRNWKQVRAPIVESNGDARVLALTHTCIAGVQPLVRRYHSHNERKAA